MDRRSLLEGEDASRQMENVFGDEFEVDDFDMVADGMRDSDYDREGGPSRNSRHEDDGAPVRGTSTQYTPVSPVETGDEVRRGSIRNSMRKSRGAMAENPFSSPEDEGSQQRMPSMSFEPDVARRSTSSTSSHLFARTGSPRFGAGPSHPYGMYPQGTIPRSSSVATSSTIRPAQRQSSLRNGPQHPYTMYPQGVSEDLDDEDEAPPNAVPVGFPGLGQPYRRQRGPDDEEQDIIGVDGHTEPLPPYTRYPEDGPEKMPLLVPTAPTPLHSRAPVAGTDPGMALMHTPLQPQQQPAPASMSDESTLLRQPTHSGSIISPQESVGKKSWSEKSWKEKRKTRICGIPFWWILLSICVVAFITAVLAGVIGGFVHERDK